jgi:RecG-like helicase
MELSVLGLPPKKQEQLEKKKIFTVEDLIGFFPRKYFDFRSPKTLRNAMNGERCAMVIVIREVNRRDKFVEVVGRERETRNQVSIKWFHQDYKYNELYNLVDMEAVVCGKFIYNQWGASFLNPDVFTTDVERGLGIYPIYSKIRGMSDEYLTNTIDKALSIAEIEETADDRALELFHLIPARNIYTYLHHPKSAEEVGAAQKRVVFDTLYHFADEMIKSEQEDKKDSTYIPRALTNCNNLIQSLPYTLTDDQKNIISEFITKARRGERIHALLQGDVGSGKTVVAFLLMMAMSDNGYQSVLMAPTGILARQHYEELCGYIEPYGLNAVYLSGDVKGKEKTEALRKIREGEAQFIVGTHAVISKGVEFYNLGLTVVDEEHKFGVLQREALKEKASEGVHSVSMSATPIPRSLALTMYGDSFDIYTISTMPAGRKPIITKQMAKDEEIFAFITNELYKGHQAYIVCPLIDDPDIIQDDEKDPPESVKEVFEKARSYYPDNIVVDVITGKMKDEEKREKIDAFKNGYTHILLATTIIEVGVNVPNATVIGIMDADRFGLAQLHQLRGRVGRNDLQSYCLLRSEDFENPRLNVMCETTDGFVIAQEDLKLRGSGEFIGTKQSGSDKNIELALKYPKFYSDIRKYVKEKRGLV